MTNEQAVNDIKKAFDAIDRLMLIRSEFVLDKMLDDVEAFDTAIEALKKQTPKKPIESADAFNENLIHLYCPSCESHVGMYNNRLRHGDMHNNTNREICAKCGQVFDLEEFRL